MSRQLVAAPTAGCDDRSDAVALTVWDQPEPQAGLSVTQRRERDGDIRSREVRLSNTRATFLPFFIVFF